MLMLTACGGSDQTPAVDLIVGRWVVPGGAGEPVAVFTADGHYTIPTQGVFPPGTERGSWSRKNEHQLNLQCTTQCPPFMESRTIDVRVDNLHLMLLRLYLGSSTVAEGSAWSSFFATIEGGSCTYHRSSFQLRLTTNGVATSVAIAMCTPMSMNASATRIVGTWTPADDGFVVGFPDQAPVTFFLMEDAVSSTRWERAL